MLDQNYALLLESRDFSPDAENDIVAVDIYSQEIYKQLRIGEKYSETKVAKYIALKKIRMQLIDEVVNNQSSFTING